MCSLKISIFVQRRLREVPSGLDLQTSNQNSRLQTCASSLAPFRISREGAKGPQTTMRSKWRHREEASCWSFIPQAFIMSRILLHVVCLDRRSRSGSQAKSVEVPRSSLTCPGKCLRCSCLCDLSWIFFRKAPVADSQTAVPCVSTVKKSGLTDRAWGRHDLRF